MSLKIGYKVVRMNVTSTGEWEYHSSISCLGIYTRQYKINESTLAPDKDKPLFIFNSLEDAQSFRYKQTNSWEMGILKCVYSPSEVILDKICDFTYCSLIGFYSSSRSSYDEKNPPKGTVFASEIFPLERV